MKRKLIEVALPLEVINREAVRESYIYRGNPSSIHKWWAQRPLAVARAIIFASLVDDPASRPDRFPEAEEQDKERQRLFGLIERLVRWEAKDDETLLAAVRVEIENACDGDPPTVIDPFSGGATLPIEAQRLGLATEAADLNPVACLIGRSLLEFPQRFAGRRPVHRDANELDLGRGVEGLVYDVRAYGQDLGETAWERLSHLYPTATDSRGRDLQVIAWLWCRTVTCPNPACRLTAPLVGSFTLSSKRGAERWAEPKVDAEKNGVRFVVQEGTATLRPTAGRNGGRCVRCATAIPLDYIASEGRGARVGTQLMAMAVLMDGRRDYLPPELSQERIARSAAPPEDVLDVELPERALGFRVQRYGKTRQRDLYTARQLHLLSTLSDLVDETYTTIEHESGGDLAYASALTTYLAFVVDKVAQFNSELVHWFPKENRQEHAFGRQTVSYTWDFAEGNPFAGIGGGIESAVSTVSGALDGAAWRSSQAVVIQGDARRAVEDRPGTRLITTDPPYYDQVGYASLSDYFYVWLRRSLRRSDDHLLRTMLAPKNDELIAEPGRFGGDADAAKAYFEQGMVRFFEAAAAKSDARFPITVYYAFKQKESRSDDGVVSTGWETMLAGLLEARLQVTGTWPTRSERGSRLRGLKSAALASAIVLVCRPRPADAPLATRREFVGALRAELPGALRTLQQGSVAPVDLTQAAIGPGMAVFSRYASVIEAGGEPMTVRAALGLINEVGDEILSEQVGDYDADTRFAVTWFEQHGLREGPAGEADDAARARNTSVAGLEEAGVLAQRAGKARLLARAELESDWDPSTDRRIAVWEAAQHLTRRLEVDGEQAAADLLRRLGADYGERAKELAYRLYSICERNGWAQDAVGYNSLVVAWPEIARLVAGTPEAEAQQALEV